MRFDRARCAVVFSNNNGQIGTINGVVGADLRFCCFSDGNGCWTITSSRSSSSGAFYQEVCGKGGSRDAMRFARKNSMSRSKENGTLIETCQERFVSNCIESRSQSSVCFDVSDSSNRASACKMSICDRADRLLCDFFSDYGRGYARTETSGTINIPETVLDDHHAQHSRSLPCSFGPFPPVGELFLDCQPIHPNEHLDLVSHFPATNIGSLLNHRVCSEMHSVPDPALSLLMPMQAAGPDQYIGRWTGQF